MRKICAFFLCLVIFGVSSVYGEEVIKIGWIGPLTGDTAVVGVDSAKVAKDVVDEVNASGGIAGKKITLIVEDDQYRAPNTVSAYRRLVHVEGVKILLVLTYGGMRAVASDAERDGVLLINPLDCDEELAALPSNSFCVAKRTEDLGIVAAQHAIRHKNTPAAIIYMDDDPFMPKVAQATRDTLVQGGAEVVLYEGGTEKLDFKALLTRVKEKGTRSLFFYGNDYFGIGMKQARQLGVTAKFYATGGINSPGFQAGAGDTIHGTYAAGWHAPRTPEYDAFLTAFKSKVGRAPLLEVATVPTYDIIRLLAEAFKVATFRDGKSIDIDSVKDFLYRVRGYKGLSGSISMDQDGAVRSFAVGMYSFDHGNFKAED